MFFDFQSTTVRIAATMLVCALLTCGLGCGDEHSHGDDGIGGHDAGHDASHDAGHELDETREKLTENGDFYVAYTPSPDPIPFNELFSLEVAVYPEIPAQGSEVLVDDADVGVDVTMPAHGHGMTTEPTVTAQSDGTFLVEGMKFHMESQTPAERWEIAVSVDRDGISDTATFEVMCCTDE